MGAQHLTFPLKFSQIGGFSPKFGIFKQTFSDEKIFDNFSTVKNLQFATAPITIRPLAMMPQPGNQIESNQNSFESNQIGFVISRIVHLYPLLAIKS